MSALPASYACLAIVGLVAFIRPACSEGITDQQIALAARLVQLESAGNQRAPNGSVLTSSAGARGLFQLMPATAARLRVNPDTAEGNVRGGLTEIVRLWNKYRGDKRLVAVAYNWGERHADEIAAGQHVELPEETRRYVIAVLSGGGSGPATTAEGAGAAPASADVPVSEPPPACAPSWDPWALASCSARLRRAAISAQSKPSNNTETASR